MRNFVQDIPVGKVYISYPNDQGTTQGHHNKGAFNRLLAAMKTGQINEQSKYWRLPQLGNVELLRASFRRHSFNRHFHEGYAIGVIEDGALGFRYRGEDVVAAKGDINLAIPGETHNGYAADPGGWRYSMFYLGLGLVQRAAAEIADRAAPPPFFSRGTVRDPQLAAELVALHRDIEANKATALETESRLVWVISRFIMRHAHDRPVPVRIGNEKHSVARAKLYIQERYDQNITLAELSRRAGLSRYHLLRVFKAETGLPPHAYHNHVRVICAKNLIARGHSIIQAAHRTGFYDQSHLNRVFKRTFGITPGQFSNSVQDM
jgi:AraC-like DNA-binding protein